jgi:phosphoglycerol transferase MdoB-like AlkP superfamily enzyme
MVIENLKYDIAVKGIFRRLYGRLAPRAYSVILSAALFCTLMVKLFHAWRMELLREYPGWVAADIAVLLGIEIVLAAACFYWPKKWVIRTSVTFAAVVCTWSVMNAGWLIRTGTQILPSVLLPLFRDPLNALSIIGVNLARMPAVAVILLVPSAVALAFFFSVLARPLPPDYSRRRFIGKAVISVVFIIFTAVLARKAAAERSSAQVVSEALRYNCHLRVLTGISFNAGGSDKTASAPAVRKIPFFDQVPIAMSAEAAKFNYNVVILVLEGIQYSYTSLADDHKDANLTPYLVSLAEQGVQFAQTRSTLTHTTKVMFSLMTGRYPSVSQDIAEAVPAAKPYASLVTILKDKLGYRTAFFQSAKGNFECRPGLVYNLGFDNFWARDDLNDPNSFLGYLACDEFSMLGPITEWFKAGSSPFLLTVLCSVTHDPYVVPAWFAEPEKEPVKRYQQSISYTDKFLAALDAELAKLNLTDKTIFCVIGDHGEAFGEHGLLGHERIAFEEALRIPWVVRAPDLVGPARVVKEPVSSIDLTPTLLALLGFDVNNVGFDGINALGIIPAKRKVYFSSWMQQSPAGFVMNGTKFVYNPSAGRVLAYDLSAGPLEMVGLELPQQARRIADEIITWRKNSCFGLEQTRTGKKILFNHWLCHWNNRVCGARYHIEAGD